MIVRALIVFFITAYLDYTLIALDVFSLHGMIMFFVVPGGALILGAAFGFAIYDSHLKTQTPAHNKRTIMLGTFLGFMIIPAVLMLQFATARMDSSGQMYYALSGDHISNYSYKGKPIDLFNFLSLLEDTTSITLSFKGSNNSIELEPDPWQYRLFTLYEMAACAGAAYYVLQRFLRKSPFCDLCQKYHKGLRVTEIPTDAWEKERWVIRNCIKNATPYQPETMSVQDKDYYSVYLWYCPDCKKGELEMQFYVRGRKGRSHADPNRVFRQHIPNVERFYTVEKQ